MTSTSRGKVEVSGCIIIMIKKVQPGNVCLLFSGADEAHSVETGTAEKKKKER